MKIQVTSLKAFHLVAKFLMSATLLLASNMATADNEPAPDAQLNAAEVSSKSALVNESKPSEKPNVTANPSVTSSVKNPYADLVNLALSGKGVSGAKNYAEAAANYCKLARDNKDANALFALGWLHTNGKGVDKNEDLAALFFKMAAEQNHTSAQTWLSNSKGNASAATLPTCMQPDPPANIASVHPETMVEEKKAETPVKQFYAKGPIYKLVSKIAPQYDIETDLVMAFIAVESGFNPTATSPKNAQGLMQLIPETAARFNVKDAYNPEQNIKGGVSYLRWLLAHFKGDVELVAAAYNAGENAVVRYQGIPPYEETRAYVKKITSLYPSSFHPYNEKLGVKPALMQVKAKEAWPRTNRTQP